MSLRRHASCKYDSFQSSKLQPGGNFASRDVSKFEISEIKYYRVLKRVADFEGNDDLNQEHKIV